jgi:two-component system, NtrC family, nitrogen regulation sensor histidine kinase NtrY
LHYDVHRIMKRSLYIFILGIGWLLLALVANYYFSGKRNDIRYQQSLETYLQAQEQISEPLLLDTTLLKQLFEATQQPIGSNPSSRLDTTLHELEGRAFTFLLFEKEKLIFWSANQQSPYRVSLDENVSVALERSLEVIKDSHYEVIKKHYLYHDSTFLTSVVLIPLRIYYGALESEHLSTYLPAPHDLWGLPAELTFRRDSINERCYPIRSDKNRLLCYMDASSVYLDKTHDATIGILGILGLLCMAWGGGRISTHLLKGYEAVPLLGVSSFVVLVSGLFYLVYWSNHNNIFGAFDFSMSNFSGNTYAIHSLRDLLTYSVFIFWVALFFQQAVSIKGFVNRPRWVRYGVAWVCYSLVVVFLLLLVGTISDLAENTQIPYVYQNVFYLKSSDFIAWSCIGLMLYALFLMTHRLIFFVTQLNIKNYYLLLIFDSAVMFWWVYANLKVSSWWLPSVFSVITFFYLYTFHYLFRRPKPNILFWTIIFLTLFTAIPTFFMVYFADKKEDEVCATYARQLSNMNDEQAERKLQALCDTLINIESIHGFKGNIGIDTHNIARNIERAFANDAYLSRHYNLLFCATDGRRAILREENLARYSSWEQRSMRQECQNDTLVKGNPLILRSTSRCCAASYWAFLNIPIINKSQAIRLHLEMQHSVQFPSHVETELLGSQRFQYKELQQLQQYAYAIYDHAICVEQNHADLFPNAQMPLADSLNIGEERSVQLSYLNHNWASVYRADKNIYIYVKKLNKTQNALGTLSFLMASLSLMLLLFSLLDRIIPFLPPILRVWSNASTSLGNKLIFPLLIFNFCTLVVLGGFTFHFFYNNSKHFEALDATGHERYISATLHKKDLSSQVLPTLNRQYWDSLANEISTLRQTAIHIFDTNGLLVGTSEKDLEEKELLPQMMPQAAWLALKYGQQKVFKTIEKIGTLSYQTQFYPLNNAQNTRIGYFELPFYENNQKYQQAASELLGQVLALSICLLFIASQYTTRVAKRLIKPIEEVGRMLEKLTLGRENVKVAPRQDELNLIISAYNNKVDELADSLQQIQDSDREKTWRDIARMIAHEIRNPLTPMLLYVQYLEHIRLNHVEKLPYYVERANKSLLEQISTLEKLAKAFSEFVQLPQAQNAQISINDVIENIETTFTEYFADKNMRFEVTLPNIEYMVYADPNLLKNALDNLILNAQQAIPNDRAGKVSVKLYHQDGYAIVQITDNGSGIPKEIQEKIFKFNFTTKTYGSGLGLGFTKSIVDAVNGKLSFETTENVGTSFFIALELAGTKARQ